MRAFLSRLLMKLANQLHWWSESLEEVAQDLEKRPNLSTKATDFDRSELITPFPDPKLMRFHMDWLRANGFPTVCSECGQLWRTIKTFNLDALAQFDDPLPDELWGRVKAGDNRGLILSCDHGHYFARCYDSAKEVHVEIEA